MLLLAGADTRVLAALAELLRAHAPVVATGVDTPDAADRAIRAAQDASTPLEACIVAPARVEAAPLEGLRASTWRHTLDTNLTAAVNVARAVGPALGAAGGGSLVFVTWHVAGGAGAHRAHEAAVAGAVCMLARACAAEMGTSGVRVNAVTVPPDALAAAAPAIELLLAPTAAYLTGEVLVPGAAPPR